MTARTGPSWRGVYDFLEGRSRAASILRMLISVAFVLAVWQVLTTYVVTNKLLLVPPAEVFEAIGKESASGALWTNALATVSAVGAAFPVAVLLGVGIGLALASSRLLALTAGPMLTALNSVPLVALAPLFIAWLGLGFASKFVLVTIFTIFPVLVTTETGLRPRTRC